MKKYFLTGLALLLPLAVTVGVIVFILNLVTDPFVGFVEDFFVNKSWYLKYQKLIHFTLQIFLLISLFLSTVLLGFLARIIVFKSLISLYDCILHRIPVVNTLYKTSKQVFTTLFGSSSKSFKQVVMVPFPKDGVYTIGFLSSHAPQTCQQMAGKPLTSVFVPTTPNPTSGYLLMFPENEIIYIDMKVEEAFKLIISCGVVNSENESIKQIENPMLENGLN